MESVSPTLLRIVNLLFILKEIKIQKFNVYSCLYLSKHPPKRTGYIKSNKTNKDEGSRQPIQSPTVYTILLLLYLLFLQAKIF